MRRRFSVRILLLIITPRRLNSNAFHVFACRAIEYSANPLFAPLTRFSHSSQILRHCRFHFVCLSLAAPQMKFNIDSRCRGHVSIFECVNGTPRVAIDVQPDACVARRRSRPKVPKTIIIRRCRRSKLQHFRRLRQWDGALSFGALALSLFSAKISSLAPRVIIFTVATDFALNSINSVQLNRFSFFDRVNRTH